MTIKGTKQPIETILKRINSRKGYRHSEETKQKMCLARKGYKPSRESILKAVEARKGYRHSEEAKRNIGNGNRGKKHTPENILKQINSHIGHVRSEESRLKQSNSLKGKIPKNIKLLHDFYRGKKRPEVSGQKCHLWKGGITPENSKIRHSLELVLWRKSCMERDNFTCQKTGVRGGILNVHHINNFSDFPELRTSIENGITLSKESHQEFHKIYGKRNNTNEQLMEFLNNK